MKSEKNNNLEYEIGLYEFRSELFLPDKIFYMINELRLNNVNEIIQNEYKNRIRRTKPWNSNLIIIAADHPARRVTQVGTNELAMGNRQDYLSRILRVLMLEEIDGLMTTPDIMDDIVILNYIFEKSGGKNFLDKKILLGCTNRGGLLGSPYEMEDPCTSYSIEDIKKLNLDGAKMMFRLDLETKMAKYSQRTLKSCSKLVRKCNEHNIPAFIEPLPVELSVNKNYKVKKEIAELIKTIGVATAIGGSSLNMWLKVPYVDNFEQVSKTTTNPILLLGGESKGNPIKILRDFEKGLKAGKNIRGCLVGRNILYPGLDDPRAVALALSKIIHDNKTTEEAVKIISYNRGDKMDFLTSLIK